MPHNAAGMQRSCVRGERYISNPEQGTLPSIIAIGWDPCVFRYTSMISVKFKPWIGASANLCNTLGGDACNTPR